MPQYEQDGDQGAPALRPELTPPALESTPEVADELLAVEQQVTADQSVFDGQMTRRNTLQLATVAAIAATEAGTLLGGIVWYVKSRTPAGRLISAKNRFVAMLQSQATVEQVVREIYSIPGIQPFIDLAHERELAHKPQGPMDVDMLDEGNSYTYLLGLMNNSGGMFHQPYAVSSVAMAGLGPDARAQLGFGKVAVASDAQIGAYSGDRYPGDPGPPYGFLSDKQLGNLGVQAYLRDGDALKVERRDMELDDLRLLIATSAELASYMGDLGALFTDDKLASAAEAHLEEITAQVPAIAAQAGANYVQAGDILAGISRVRIARGLGRLLSLAVICWSLKEQPLMPANTLTERPSAAALKYLIPDPTGPNRYFLNVSSIPYGSEIAHWIWVEMTRARGRAVRSVLAKHGDVLGIVPENLSRVNRDPDFYQSDLLGKKGNGHAGRKGIVDTAVVELGLFHNKTPGGIVIASSLANVQPPKVA